MDSVVGGALSYQMDDLFEFAHGEGSFKETSETSK